MPKSGLLFGLVEIKLMLIKRCVDEISNRIYNWSFSYHVLS